MNSSQYDPQNRLRADHPLAVQAAQRRVLTARFQGGGGYGSRPGEIPGGYRPAALGGPGYPGYSGDANEYRGISGGAIQGYLQQSTPFLNQQGPVHQAYIQG